MQYHNGLNLVAESKILMVRNVFSLFYHSLVFSSSLACVSQLKYYKYIIILFINNMLEEVIFHCEIFQV